MTIGLFLLGAVALIYVSTSTSSRSSNLESQLNEDASLTLELLQQQIRLAGFSTLDASGNRVFSGIAVRGCDGGFTTNNGTTAFDSLACAASSTGSDALAIRYEATTLNTPTAKDGGGIERPTNCSYDTIAAWNFGGAANAPLADNRYYVADDTANDNISTLFCKGKTGTGFSAATALVPNIEELQIKYAVTKAPVDGEILPHQVTAYVEAKDASLGSTASNWSRVAGVRICIVARTSQPVPVGDNQISDLGKYYDCDGTQKSQTDRYLRRAYHTTIQLRNMRPGIPSDYNLNGGVVRDPWAYQTTTP
jgi:type IV pilus assembly protein PilW